MQNGRLVGARVITMRDAERFEEVHQELLEIYNSSDRIPYVGVRGSWLYNFWRDEEHVRGVWRRTFLDEYVKEDPSWETVLDLDALAGATAVLEDVLAGTVESGSVVYPCADVRYVMWARRLPRGGAVVFFDGPEFPEAGPAPVPLPVTLGRPEPVPDGFTLERNV